MSRIINLNDNIKDCKNFKYSDIINSSTAKARNIDNKPTDDSVWDNAEYLAKMCLQPARDHFKTPIIVNSWYRSPNLNKAVGGSSASFHAYGMAADIVFASRGGPDLLDLFEYFYNSKQFTELIAEEIGMGSGWIHIAISKGREKENQLKYKLRGAPVKRNSFEEIIKVFK